MVPKEHCCYLLHILWQSQVHTAVVMASQHPATLAISHLRILCHSSTRRPQASQLPGLESIHRAPLHHLRHSRHFLRCRLATYTSNQDLSRHHWMPNSMLAIFVRSQCQGIMPHRLVSRTYNMVFSHIRSVKIAVRQIFFFIIHLFRGFYMLFNVLYLLLRILCYWTPMYIVFLSFFICICCFIDYSFLGVFV